MPDPGAPSGGDQGGSLGSDWTGGSRITTGSVPGETRGGGQGFTPGTILAGRYRVVSLLGRGGMGEVFRADDTKLGQAVALKFVRGSLSPALLQRLYAEVRLGRCILAWHRLLPLLVCSGLASWVAAAFTPSRDWSTSARSV